MSLDSCNKFWLELPPEVFLQLHSQAGLSDEQLRVIVKKAFKAGMLKAGEIVDLLEPEATLSNSLDTWYKGNQDSYYAIQDKAEDL